MVRWWCNYYKEVNRGKVYKEGGNLDHMTTKTLFPLELTDSNRAQRDYLRAKFKRYTDLRHSDLLEIGIANGRFGVLLADKVAHYYGIDPEPEYVEMARTNIPAGAKVRYEVGSAEQIPFTQQFEIVLYAHSWHYVTDHQKALQEAARVLKPAGIVAILEPLATNQKWHSLRLQPGSPEFDEVAYQRKRESIVRGRNTILGQNIFKIVEDEYDSRVEKDFYVLRRRE